MLGDAALRSALTREGETRVASLYVYGNVCTLLTSKRTHNHGSVFLDPGASDISETLLLLFYSTATVGLYLDDHICIL